MKRKIIEFIDGYETDSSGPLGRKFTSVQYSGALSYGVRRRENRRFFRFLSDIGERIAYMTSKAYGAMSLAFGLVTIILSFLEDYGSVTGEATTLSFIIGVGFALLAIPLLLSDEPLSLLLQEMKFTDIILFEFLRVNRVPKNDSPKTVPTVIPLIFGVCIAMLGYFIPAVWVVSGFFGIVYIVLAASSPEFSFIFTIMTLPVIGLLDNGGIVLSVMITVTLLSFLKKVGTGKRVLVIEQYDILLLMLVLAIAISGIFNKGIDSFADAMVEISALLIYVLASNIVTGRRLADNVFIAVAVSAVPVCVVSFVQLILGSVKDGFVHTLDGGISSVFDSTGVLAVYLLAVIVIVSILAKEASGVLRGICISLLALTVLCLALTGEAFAMLALLIGVLACVLMNYGGFAVPIILGMLAIPYFILILPIAPSSEWLSYTSNSGMLSILPGFWRICLSVLVDNFLTGIGIGEESFAAEMGGGVVTNAQNLFIELAMEAGVLALLILLAMLAIRLRHRLNYMKYVRSSDLDKASPALFVGIIALVTYGAVSYIWSDPISCSLFWCLFGLGAATLRIAKQEHDNRVLYYEDTGSHHSSAIDVDI